MPKPVITQIGHLEPQTVQSYERYLPTAFDESLSILEKINKVIQYMNKLGQLTKDVVDQWNAVMEWILNEGLEEAVTKRLQEWLADGTLEDIINEALFGNILAKLDLKQDIDKLPFINLLNDKDLVKDGTKDMTAKLQGYFDALADGGTIIIPKGTYLVSKNTSLTGFPNDDQPCLVIRNKSNIKVIGQDATFRVNTHAQGILEIQLSENVIVEGIAFKGLGLFPAIDTNTGYGEKGTSAGGYDTSGFWGYRKNNCFDTSERINPSTSKAYGTFNGGFIGNVGIGLLIHNNCKRVSVRNCEAYGFNYSGFQVGHLGDRVPTVLGYGINEDITFEECYTHNNYSQGFYSMDSKYLKYDNNIVEDNGHPNASVNHTYVDPGYGISMWGGNLANSEHTTIVNNKCRGNKRRGIDSHKGTGVIIQNNIISDSMIAGIMIKNNDPQQRAYDFDISNNKLYNIGSGMNPGSAISFVGLKGANYSEDNVKALGRINYNTIENCFAWLGLIEVGAFNNIEVIGNQIKDIMLPGNRASNPSNKPCGIYVGYSLQSEKCYFGIIKDNIIDGGGFTDLIGGLTIRNMQEGIVSGNVFKTASSQCQFGLRVWDCQLVNVIGNAMWLSSSGVPYESLRNESTFINNDSRGGAPSLGETPLAGRTLHLRIDVASGSPTVTVYSGAEYFDGVEDDVRGVRIKLKNTQRGIVPQMRAQYGSATGMNSISEISTYLFNHTTLYDFCTLAVYTERGGTAIPYSTWNVGALNIYITV